MKTDVLVIGAGPIGIYVTFYLNTLGLSILTIDAMPKCGGQCEYLYPDKYIYDIPAFEKITGHAFVENLQKQTLRVGSELMFEITALNVEKLNGRYSVLCEKNKEKFSIEAKYIIIATGNGVLSNIKMPIEGVESFFNKTVLNSVDDINIFKDKNILIAGGGDSAVDWAIECSRVASSVILIHRRDKFRAKEININMMKKLSEEGKIKILFPYSINSVEGNEESGEIKFVNISNLETNENLKIECDYLLPFYGVQSANVLNFDSKYFDLSNNIKNFETSQEDIFSIGDASKHEGKLKMILSGLYEASIVSREIKKRISSR